MVYQRAMKSGDEQIAKFFMDSVKRHTGYLLEYLSTRDIKKDCGYMTPETYFG